MVELVQIDQDKCISCQLCIPYCPMEAINVEETSGVTIDLYECVECSICRHAGVCPTDALQQQELHWPRSLRRDFSDPLFTHSGTGVPGRGTEEMKTNEVTGRIPPGRAGIAAEIGRPGTGTSFGDVQKVARAVAQLPVRFEPDNPVYHLMRDPDTGDLREDVLDERVLSAIVEFSVPIEGVEEALNSLRRVSEDIDTVFSVALAARAGEDGAVPATEAAQRAGMQVSINGKVNVGLGRPRAGEVQS